VTYAKWTLIEPQTGQEADWGEIHHSQSGVADHPLEGRRCKIVADQSEASMAIRTDLRAIFRLIGTQPLDLVGYVVVAG
jgi:hypothetical protein